MKITYQIRKEYSYANLNGNIYFNNKIIKLSIYVDNGYEELTDNQCKEKIDIEISKCLKKVEENKDWILQLPKGWLYLTTKFRFTIKRKKDVKYLVKGDYLVYSKNHEFYCFDSKLWIPKRPLFNVKLGDVVLTYSKEEIEEKVKFYTDKGAKLDLHSLNYFIKHWSNKKLICCSIERRGYTEPSYCIVNDLKKNKSEQKCFNNDSRNFDIDVWNEDGDNEMEIWYIKQKLYNIFDKLC